MREEFADRLKTMIEAEIRHIEDRSSNRAAARQQELEMVVALHEAANAINDGRTFRPAAGC